MQEIPSSPFKFIWFAVKPYKKWFFLAILFVSLADLFGGLQSYTFKGFVDAANLYATGNDSTRTVFLWVLMYPVLLFLSVGAIRSTAYMLNYFSVYARTRAIKTLFEYLSLHSQSYFNDRFSGALSEKVNTISFNVSRLLDHFIWNILSLFISFFISAGIILSVSQTVALAFVCGFIILIPINLILSRGQAKLSSQRAELSAKLKGQVIDVVTNIVAVQQYARRFFEIIRLDKSITEFRDTDLRRGNYREWVLIINNILVGIFISTVIIWTFFVWSKGLITIGALVMIVALTRGFMRDLTHIGQHINNVAEAYAEMQNGLKEIIRPHDITDKTGARKLQVTDGSVMFENVSFVYDKDQRKIFESLSFDIKGGEKVGIVGTSGAGKTTLMKLLLRQHDIIGGNITIDGQDIQEVTQESLRENISIVPQEPMLFHRTIRENILYGKLDATEEEMIEVAKKAQAHDFIEMLPQKYDSLVGERGVKLSVGQRQRIAIARAFLKNAPILILDEATSALDSESEVAVQKALHALMEGKTVFAIAHRLSTLRDMDRILVFKDGQIAEDGTHRTLLKNKEGVYASFWSHQAGGFIK